MESEEAYAPGRVPVYGLRKHPGSLSPVEDYAVPCHGRGPLPQV